MNEASSKFVDKLAMEKLISEKLAKVRHSPDDSFFKKDEISLNCIDDLQLEKSQIKLVDIVNGISHFQIPSFYKQPHYLENNLINIYYYPSDNPQCNILLLHGLFDDNMANYLFLIKQLNELNFNIYFMVLPYHFERRPEGSFFGGEYFFSADLFRTRNAFKQTVLDIEASMQFIGYHNSMPKRILGFSMGGCAAFRYYLLKKSLIKTFLLNPVTEFKKLAWDNNLLLTVGRDLDESLMSRDEVLKILAEIDPCENIGPDFKVDNLTMVYSIYDQVIEKVKYDAFINKIGIKNAIEYSSGHLNVLRVPRLSRDIFKFLNNDESIHNSDKNKDVSNV
ncbi:MAG TPA: alpha/beta hydrolase [Pseudobacteroides sp.]|uniref:alpha/beta hydrolase n=1 Tax=Pseudobacteroides sp. TaxID=1968840 RepID=UPI002F93AC94